ncbi:hypothetical protein INT43_007224 [Umbelopsis isabellina]|uniref:Phosphotransferase n=1 Tax=Mortierella isabellina TaxID=91625 RepID=A0A8H7PXW6_MORIS|nr:hypothetical protein INT43_007224 [Umbelopsis isabellina]
MLAAENTAKHFPSRNQARMQSSSGIDLAYASSTQTEALADIYKKFHVSDAQLATLIARIKEEMQVGLLEDDAPDLKMIPSFVTGYPTGQEEGVYLALEISGMDIYVCQVKLKGQGGKLAINQYQYKIPGELATGEDIADLIDYIADCVSDFLIRVGSQDLFVYPMAISFGFAVEQTALNQGYILALGHGFDYANGVGCDIVDLIHIRFQRKGLCVRVVAIANDTVCTLLAHAYQHPSTKLGIVHSAGTNCAYYEKMENIHKLQNAAHPAYTVNGNDMIINTEWCNFGSKNRHMPSTWFDRKLDRESNNPNVHIFEKMTTGIYLGELVRIVLIHLIDNEQLFGGNSSEVLNIPYSFDTSYMYVCENDDPETLDGTGVILKNMLKVGKSTMADREMVRKVCEIISDRATKLVGASTASVVQYMVEHGIGMDSQSPGFAISISGDIYEDYPSFHPRVCKTLKKFLPDDIAAKLSVGIVKHSRIVGAAIVAMMAEKQDESIAYNNR